MRFSVTGPWGQEAGRPRTPGTLKRLRTCWCGPPIRYSTWAVASCPPTAPRRPKSWPSCFPCPWATTLVGKGVFPEDHPLSLGLGVYPRSRFATGTALHINRKADVVLAGGNSYRMPNAPMAGQYPTA